MVDSKVDYVRLEEDESILLEKPKHYYQADLDGFLRRVYEYYRGKGFSCIVLSRIFNLLTFLWVAVFLVIVLEFINYDDLLNNPFTLHIPTNPLVWLLIAGITIFELWQAVTLLLDIRGLLEIKSFYHNELGISESQLQTILWSEAVKKIIEVPSLCTTKEKLTPLDIAHRIMRKENYMIALMNKDVLTLQLPLPRFNHYRLITKTLEWSLNYTIFSHAFSGSSIRYEVIQAKDDPLQRRRVINALRRQFRVLGFVGLLLSPFILMYLFVFFILKYGEELRNRPNSLSLRQWSRLARWKFREFNELPHYFQDRLNRAYSPATDYINQFISYILVIVARFISFICGSIVVAIFALGFFEDDLFQSEIFGRSILWYLGVSGAVLALCRAVIPDDHTVFQPELYLQQVYQYTHYKPKSWRKRAHTPEVRQEFEELFEYRIIGFLREVFSVVITPVQLLFSLPHCAEDVVMFFSEYTVEVDGVGHVCAFADFRFDQFGNPAYGSVTGPEPGLVESGMSSSPMKSGASSSSLAVSSSALGGSSSSSSSSSSSKGPMPAHPFGLESSQLENSDVTITIKPQASMFESESEDPEAKRKGTKQGKMEKSFLTFKATYPDWEPNTPQGKKMIDNLSVFLMEQADRMQAGPMGTSMYATRNMGTSSGLSDSRDEYAQSIFNLQLSELSTLQDSFYEGHSNHHND